MVDPEFIDLLQIQEAFKDVAATLKGLVTQLEDQGFTSEEAHAIVTAMFTMSTKPKEP